MTELDERLARALREAVPAPERTLDGGAIRANAAGWTRRRHRLAPVLAAAAVVAVAAGVLLTVHGPAPHQGRGGIPAGVSSPHMMSTGGPSSAIATAPATPDTTFTGTAHGCTGQVGATVTLTANPDGFAPNLGCVGIRSSQRLRIVNNTNGYGQTGKTITVGVRGLPTLTIPPGSSATYAASIGSYLAPGQHFGTCSCGPHVDFDIVVIP
jgi:hypothetical protein